MPSHTGNQTSDLCMALSASQGRDSAPANKADEIYISFFNGQPQAGADSFQCSDDALDTGFFGQWDLE